MPQVRHPARLKDQEGHDQQAEDRLAQRHKDLRGIEAEDVAEGQQAEAQEFRHQRHEDRAQDRAQHRPLAADDHRGEKEDRDLKVELLGRHEAVEVDQEPAGDPRKERAEGKGEQLVVDDVHAKHRGGQVPLSHRDEGPPDPRPDHVRGEHG